jgi:hypothetical protein
MDTKDKTISIDSDNSIETTLTKILNILNEEEPSPHVEQVKDYIKIIIEYQNKLIRGTSRADGFIKMSLIEHLLSKQTELIREADLKALLQVLKKTKAEDELIAQKKTNISNTT